MELMSSDLAESEAIQTDSAFTGILLGDFCMIAWKKHNKTWNGVCVISVLSTNVHGVYCVGACLHDLVLQFFLP